MNIKVWKTHIRQISEGATVSLATEMKKNGAYVIGRKPKKRGFVATNETEDNFSVYMKNLIHDLKNQSKHGIAESDSSMGEAKLDETIDSLIEQTRDLANKYAQQSDTNISPSVLREKKLLDLGLTFLKAASIGDVSFGRAYIEAGLPVNFQHPETRRTALHTICTYSFETESSFAGQSEFANMLLDTDDFDLLRTDILDRLAYEMIYRFAPDIDLTERVKEMTLEQAKERGVKVNIDFEVKVVPTPD